MLWLRGIDPDFNTLYKDISSFLDEKSRERENTELPVNTYQDDENIYVTIPAAGLKKDAIDLEYGHGNLLINLKKTVEKDEKCKCIRQERIAGEWTRELALPAEVDPGSIAARYENGILTVSMTKRPEARPRRIAID